MQKISLLLTTILVAGCTVQTATTPPFTVQEAFTRSGETAPEQRWWRHFNIPALNEAVESALGDNFTIKTAIARFDEMEATARQAGAALLPAAEISGSASARQQNSSSHSRNFTLGLAASYEIDLWGRLRAIRKAAKAQLLASREAFNTTALSVAAETATTWFSCVENNIQLELVRKQQELNRKTEAIIELRVRTGQTEIADLLQQRQLVQKDEAAIAALTVRSAQLGHRLNILLGRPPKPAWPLPELTSLPELPPLPATGLPLTLLQRRPDIQQAWLALQAADQHTAAAIASRLPSLSLRAGSETEAASSSQLFTNWLTSLAANLAAPIFDAGSRKAEVSRREAIARQQYHLWSESMLAALQEVEDILAEEQALVQQLASGEAQLQLARDAVAALTNRYRQGATNYQRVLQVTLSAQELERSLLTTRLQLLSKRIALYRALSGGLPETLFQQRPPDNG